jgi:hypothetical protein
MELEEYDIFTYIYLIYVRFRSVIIVCRHSWMLQSSRLLQVTGRFKPSLRRLTSNAKSLAPTVRMDGHPTWTGFSLSDLPKSHNFTTHLPPDPTIPSPQASKEASPKQLRVSRPVKNALFTWVAPETNENPQLLATSWKAVRDLGLNVKEVETDEFLNLMSGNKIYEEHYPWGKSHLCEIKMMQHRITGGGNSAYGHLN